MHKPNPQPTSPIGAAPHKQYPKEMKKMGAQRVGARDGSGIGRTWATPQKIFDQLNAEFDFTLDPCATPQSAKCQLFYTEADDGLSKDWGTHKVFMNPPYGSEIYQWIKKARESAAKGALVVGLLPANTSTSWFHDDVLGHAEIRFIRGKFRFLVEDGTTRTPFAPSIYVIWRPSR